MSEDKKRNEEIENVEIEPLSDDSLDSVSGGAACYEGDTDGCPSDECPTDGCPSDECPTDGCPSASGVEA